MGRLLLFLLDNGLMTVKIIRYSQLPSDLRDDLSEQDGIIFTEVIENAPDWAAPDWEVLVFEGEQWVSALELFDRFIRVEHHYIHVVGIGGVKTLPEFRRHGYGEKALQAATRFLCEQLQVSFGLLVCGPHLVDYYGRLGWQRLNVTTYHHQNDGYYAFPGHINTLIYPCGDETWPDGDIDLLGLPF